MPRSARALRRRPSMPGRETGQRLSQDREGTRESQSRTAENCNIKANNRFQNVFIYSKSSVFSQFNMYSRVKQLKKVNIF